MHWYDLTLNGIPVHAGPTPMESRRDPFMALHKIVERLYNITESAGPWARITFGDISAKPGSRNTVPQQITLAVDIRHPDQKVLDTMDDQLRDIVAECCAQTGIPWSLREEWRSPAVEFDSQCIAAVRRATEKNNYPHREMFSGAGHDAVYVSRCAPTAMIFRSLCGGCFP